MLRHRGSKKQDEQWVYRHEALWSSDHHIYFTTQSAHGCLIIAVANFDLFSIRRNNSRLCWQLIELARSGLCTPVSSSSLEDQPQDTVQNTVTVLIATNIPWWCWHVPMKQPAAPSNSATFLFSFVIFSPLLPMTEKHLKRNNFY